MNKKKKPAMKKPAAKKPVKMKRRDVRKFIVVTEPLPIPDDEGE